ncbi:ABC protein, subfamily ABCG [Penaeus vannamei]|uniref:ABC protein, subfamily ABCG n=1 Tax=Penaeus vannamei TaxID=6689 RepID=A0A423U1M4_PENVA|nr:ABC protein, subfamily ABCG [Penaeus vannamei]
MMFDKLLLLAEGRLAYMGSSSGALEFLDGLGHKCPATFNPADFYIHTLAVQPGHELRSRERIKRICDNFAVSAYAKDIDITIQYQDNMGLQYADRGKSTSYSGTGSSGQTSTESVINIVRNVPQVPNWWVQLYWLTWRALLDSYRNPSIHGIRILQKILMALLIGVCYTNTYLNQQGIQDIEGVLFIFITENTFPSIYAVLNIFPLELPLFLREYRNGIYRSDTYYMAKMFSMLPGFILDPIIFTTICYWMVGLQHHSYQFFMTVLIIIFTTSVASACGAMFSAMFENIEYSQVILVPFDILMLITGGLFVNLTTLPWFIGWTKYISWFMYSNEALTITQWTGVNKIAPTYPHLPHTHPHISTPPNTLTSTYIQPIKYVHIHSTKHTHTHIPPPSHTHPHPLQTPPHIHCKHLHISTPHPPTYIHPPTSTPNSPTYPPHTPHLYPLPHPLQTPHIYPPSLHIHLTHNQIYPPSPHTHPRKSTLPYPHNHPHPLQTPLHTHPHISTLPYPHISTLPYPHTHPHVSTPPTVRLGARRSLHHHGRRSDRQVRLQQISPSLGLHFDGGSLPVLPLHWLRLALLQS